MNIRRLVKRLIPTKLFAAIEPYGHLAEAAFFNAINGFPAHGMKVIGVTGTNGKTSTSFLVHRMLVESGVKAGLMTTIAYGAGQDIRPQGYHMTNVPVPELMKRLKWMRAQGVEWLVLETTSMALAQHRVWGVPYSVAVLTNITHDHLDYHKTFECYVAAKQRLFRLANKNRRGLRLGIINAEDVQAERFAGSIKNVITYGVKQGNLRASEVRLTPAGSRYHAKIGADEYAITCQLPGEFNVYNSLAAVAVGRALGLSSQQIEQGIAALDGVAGRMARVDAGQPFTVLVDYAHTPDALKNALQTARTIAEGKVSVVFGATGNRDKSKRPVMGEVAAKLADKIFLTDDETYDEDPATIRQAVYEGIIAAGGDKKTEVVGDRREAIAAACRAAGTGDVVLLAGIGHQDHRVMAGQKQPWDEAAIAQGILKKLK